MIKISLRNLARNKRRNAATVFAIAFGYGGLILLGGYIIRVEQYLRVNTVYVNHTGHVSIYHHDGLDRAAIKPAKFSLSGIEQKAILDIVSQDPNVEFSGRFIAGTGLVGNGCKTVPFVAQGVEPEVDLRIRNHPKVRYWTPELRELKKGQGFWTQSQDGVVSVTPGLARLLGKSSVYGDAAQPSRMTSSDSMPITQAAGVAQPSTPAASCGPTDTNVQLAGRTYDGSFSAVDAEVIAHHTTGMDLMENSSLVAPLALLQRLYDTDAVTYLAVFLKNDSDLGSYAKTLEKQLREKGFDLDVFPFDNDKIGTFYVGGVNFLLVMGAFFVFLIFGVVVLSAVNSLTMTLIERTREMGTLRSIGFTPKHLARMLVGENFVLSLASLVAGCSAALLVARVVNSLNIRFRSPGIAGDMQFVLTPDTQLCVVMALLIGALVVVTTYVTTLTRIRGKNVSQLLTASSA